MKDEAMLKKIIILGTGGNCIDILDTINCINDSKRVSSYECVGFLDDNQQNWGKEHFGVPVLGPLNSAQEYPDHFFINGIGSPLNFWKKKEIISKTNLPGERFETIIHPTASVSSMASLGYGVVVFQNVTITSNVKIGNHVIVLPNCVISHDDVLGDYTCIAGGVCISGGVTVGHSCYLGTNSAIIGNVNIGNYCLIGMGSIVLEKIADNLVVVGNPARFLRKTMPENQMAEA
jgi:sugar O-acyltransferase (sialic acid O-acetyltransferase NeuD family)